MNSTMKRPFKMPAIVLLASFIIVVAGMKAASPLLVPFFVAVFIGVICAPPMFWLQGKGVPKVVALVLILVVILLVGLLFGALIAPPLGSFLLSLPVYQERLTAYMTGLIRWLHEQGVNISPEEVASTFHPGWVMSLAGGIFSALSGVLADAFLILLLTVLGFVVVHIVLGSIIEPKLMGRGLSLSTLVVLLSMVFWGWVMGPIGMILSVPMTSLIKIALESYEDTRGLAIMLGSGSEIDRTEGVKRRRK